MLDQPDAVAAWHDVLGSMFTDRRFRQFKKFCWYGKVGGARVGVVIANRGTQYANYALNKGHFDHLLAAKQSGKLDHAFIVAAANGTYITHHDAEKYVGLLADLQPRSGQFGEFWTLTEFDVTGEDSPF
jgi:hypothetical protein